MIVAEIKKKPDTLEQIRSMVVKKTPAVDQYESGNEIYQGWPLDSEVEEEDWEGEGVFV